MQLNKNQWINLKAKILNNLQMFRHISRNIYAGNVPGIGYVVADHYYGHKLRVGEIEIEITAQVEAWRRELYEVYLAISTGNPNALVEKDLEETRKREHKLELEETRKGALLRALGE